jgi:DNA gyrase/topoisomerase IV subunit A
MNTKDLLKIIPSSYQPKLERSDFISLWGSEFWLEVDPFRKGPTLVTINFDHDDSSVGMRASRLYNITSLHAKRARDYEDLKSESDDFKDAINDLDKLAIIIQKELQKQSTKMSASLKSMKVGQTITAAPILGKLPKPEAAFTNYLKQHETIDSLGTCANRIRLMYKDLLSKEEYTNDKMIDKLKKAVLVMEQGAKRLEELAQFADDYYSGMAEDASEKEQGQY